MIEIAKFIPPVKGKLPGQALCTGTVISRRWILTAGHCVEGALSILVIFWYDKALDPEQTFTHPRYFVRISSLSGRSAFNDIGLIRMPPINDSITPVSLPLPHDDTEYIDLARKLVIISQGMTQLANAKDPDFKKTRATGWLSSYRCNLRDLLTTSRLTELCLFSLFPHQFVTCGGDSGSPIFSEKGHRRVVMAVLSSAYHSCLKEEKSLSRKLVTSCERVAFHMPWILHTIDADPSHHDLDHLMSSWMTSPFIILELP